MDPDLPKGQQYRSMCPERPLANYQKEVSNAKEFKLSQIRAEAAVARKEEALRDSVEKAKWTAVNQHVDYDQYRQLCLGANLKPVEPGAIENIMDNKAGGKTRRSRRRGNKGEAPTIKEALPEPTEAPDGRDEFDRQWRAACKDNGSKFRYLCLIPPQVFAKILQVEIGFDLLGEILLALDECWVDQEAEVVYRILRCLPEAFRFDLAVSFLGGVEKQAAQRLTARLMEVEGLPKEELTDLITRFE